MVDVYYLVLIETSGNQDYIFSTNKLKENIGASELTYQAGTRWVLEAVATVNETESFANDSKRLRKLLRDPNLNPPIESGEKRVEILTAASGKALLITRDELTAQEIISNVTYKALDQAPGLDVSGVVQKIDRSQDFAQAETLAKAIATIHKTFEKMRSRRRASPDHRFLRLPILASCVVSGLPAAKVEMIGSKKVPISHASVAKRNRAKDAQDRLTALDERLESQIAQLLQEDESKDDQRSWLGIVHADGNGLGQIFLDFHGYIGQDKRNRTYIQAYREFSLALDECTEAAFKTALNVLPQTSNKTSKEVVPIVPLIIGGDDLTIVCDGHYALEFTKTFLQEFEAQTTKHDGIRPIAQAAFGVPRLSACAGVAIVKRHFPFSVAYRLAEKLIKSAKDVKKKITNKADERTPVPCSALDFHILYDTSNVDLKEIRKRLNPQVNVRLYNCPYVVSNIENFKGANGEDWAVKHQWERLEGRIKRFNSQPSKAPDKAPISSSQSHLLRTALLLGKAAADSQYQLIQQRYDLMPFEESEGSLFHLADGDIHATSFLDALDASDFFENVQTREPQSEVEITE